MGIGASSKRQKKSAKSSPTSTATSSDTVQPKKITTPNKGNYCTIQGADPSTNQKNIPVGGASLSNGQSKNMVRHHTG